MSGREKTKEQLISELKAHITANPDLIFIQDGKGMYTGVYANPELLFLPAEEIVGRYCIDVLPEHVTKKILGAIAEVKNDRQMVEFEYQLEVPAGSKYFSARLVRSGVDSFMSIIREVTEQKKAEDAFLSCVVHLSVLFTGLPGC